MYSVTNCVGVNLGSVICDYILHLGFLLLFKKRFCCFSKVFLIVVYLATKTKQRTNILIHSLFTVFVELNGKYVAKVNDAITFRARVGPWRTEPTNFRNIN